MDDGNNRLNNNVIHAEELFKKRSEKNGGGNKYVYPLAEILAKKKTPQEPKEKN